MAHTILCLTIQKDIGDTLTLVLALPHDLDGQWTQHKHVDQACDGNGCHWQERVQPILRGQKSRETEGLTASACCQSHDDWKRGLHREIDREYSSLQAGELRPRQGAEGHNPAHEGLMKGQRSFLMIIMANARVTIIIQTYLVELSTQQGTITGNWSVLFWSDVCRLWRQVGQRT